MIFWYFSQNLLILNLILQNRLVYVDVSGMQKIKTGIIKIRFYNQNDNWQKKIIRIRLNISVFTNGRNICRILCFWPIRMNKSNNHIPFRSLFFSLFLTAFAGALFQFMIVPTESNSSWVFIKMQWIEDGIIDIFFIKSRAK